MHHQTTTLFDLKYILLYTKYYSWKINTI